MRWCRGKMMGFHSSLSHRLCAKKNRPLWLICLHHEWLSAATGPLWVTCLFYALEIWDILSCSTVSLSCVASAASTLVYRRLYHKLCLLHYFWLFLCGPLSVCMQALLLLPMCGQLLFFFSSVRLWSPALYCIVCFESFVFTAMRKRLFITTVS